MTLQRVLGVLGAVLLASSARAADKPDLAALRDAVALADKKGENVGAIREALTALEKAFTKGATKVGEAPPELIALRDAVEMASKKGENVELIAKELGKVEKALTGREYERPKPPEPKPEPVPEPVPPLRRPGFGGGRIGGRMVIGGPGVTTTAVTITNGRFAIKSKHNDVTYEIAGVVTGDEKPKIVVRDGEKKPIEADDVKDVPEEYRAMVEKLLASVRR